jgi:hypothetical protein
MEENNFSSRRARTTTRLDPGEVPAYTAVKRLDRVDKPKRRRRRRQMSLDMEIQRSAKQIYEQGFSEAMKAAALMVCARKLDEVRTLLVAAGLNTAGFPRIGGETHQTPAASAVVTNPCVHCGRQGIYKTKPSQFNRTGSWYCRLHQPLANQIEAEDRMDRSLAPAPALAAPTQPEMFAPPVTNGHAAAGASSLSEAMGLAQVVDEQPR